ncbi:MAG: hypothetical protein GTO02_00145 [Candidatus Dadabacteria bacterium]|nr:hypothetical protein [Candidatus Dadabacteria bacterium]NIQ12860.1 hypothetical protein [Candidatus Dadabacteria bacterium]
MVIECAECGTRYEVEDGNIAPPGKMARCSRCGNIFFVDSVIKIDEEEVVESNPFSELSEDEFKDEAQEIKLGNTTDDEIDDKSFDWENLTPSDLQIDNRTTEDINIIDSTEDKDEESPDPFKAPETLKIDDNLSMDSAINNFSDSSFENVKTEKNVISERVNLKTEKKSSGSNFFAKIFYNLMSLFAILIIIGTIFFVLGNLEVIPKNQFEKYKAIVINYLPINLEYNKLLRYASINNVESKWINTKNGYMFLVTGDVVNKHEQPLSYIKLRSKFYSAGEDLYVQEFYSGNTLTLSELRNNSESALLKKINNRGGDIDFDDIDSLKGKNFDIKPNSSVPFYSFYLSKSKILGLKFKIDIVDLDILVSD